MSIIQVPRELLQTSTVRRRTKVLLGAMLVLLLIMVLLVVAAIRAESRYRAMVMQVDREARVLPQRQPPAQLQAAAETAALDYLQALPYPLPLAQGLSRHLGRDYVNPSSGQTTVGAPIPVASLSIYRIQYSGKVVLVQLLAQPTRGSGWLVVVPMQMQGQVPVLVAYPSLLPYTAAVSPPQALTAPPAQGVPTLSIGAQAQLDAWAKAWAANDQAQLYSLSGDTANQTFFGLGGWTLQGSPQVVQAQQRGDQELVTLVLTLAAQSNPSQVLQAAYQVLLQPMNQPLPYVVAWGPAGVGWSLRPYQQALPGQAPVSLPASS